MKSLMQLSSSIMDEIKRDEMVLVMGGNLDTPVTNNGSGVCDGVNNADGLCHMTNNGSGVCKKK